MGKHRRFVLEEANNLGTTFREAMETGELPDSPPEFRHL